MFWLAASAHLAAAPHTAPVPSSAVRAPPAHRVDSLPETRALLPPRAQARLEAVLEHFDLIEGGIAWKMRW